MRLRVLRAAGAVVLFTAVVLSVTRTDAGQDLAIGRQATHLAAGNEAIGWSADAAELVNVGLTAREQTIVNVAMFEAANAVTRRYRPYGPHLTAKPQTSIDAAVSTAAYQSLIVVWPQARGVWDALYAQSMERLPDSPGKEQGVALGRAAAASVLAIRSRDTPIPGPSQPWGGRAGMWQPNPAELTLAQAGPYAPALGTPPLTMYASWKPWVLTTAAQFRPAPPPALTSAAYARDLNEVKTYGSFSSATRTVDQTREVLFYMTPAPRIYGPFAHQLARERKLDVTDSSRFFALLSLALIDSQIACWDAKLTYMQWRPLAGIRGAADDANPATEADPAWIPRVPTPQFPDYPAAHSCSAGAASEVLALYLQPNEPVVLHSPSTGILPGSGETRRYADLDAVKQGVANARVYGGVHFRTSTAAGTEIGTQVGKWILQHALVPLPSQVVRHE